MNPQKRRPIAFSLLFISILVPLLLFSPPYNTYAAVKDTPDRTIRVGGDNNYPPYEYVDANGIYKGFNVDIMRAIGIELGLDLEIIPMTWNDARVALQQGKVDVVQGMTYSPARGKIYDFSMPLVTNSQAIFVRRETRYIDELSNLSGAAVAVQKGDISSELVKQVPGVRLIETANQEQALENLLGGKVDAFVGNRLTGLYIIQRDHKTEYLKIVGEPISPTAYSAVVLKGNTELLKLLNKGIGAIKKNGTYNKIYGKWFGEEIIDESRVLKTRLTIALSFAALIWMALLVIFYWNRTLKRKIDDHTRLLQEANQKLLLQKEQLEKSNRLKEKILENSLNGIIACDLEGNVLSYNSMAQTLLGFPPSRPGSVPGVHIPDCFDPRHINLAIRDKTITKVEEKPYTVLDGEERLLSYDVAPILNATAQPEGVIISFRDITEDRRLKEQLFLQDRIQSLGQIAAGVAHELRNPLSSIQTFVELIPQKMDNPSFREQIARYLPAEIRRLDGLINNLLDFTRTQQFKRHLVSVKEVLTSVMTLFQNQARQRKVDVRIECPDHLRVYCDSHQLQQILLNLLLNSLQSLDEAEGGTIVVTGRETDPEKVAIEISDNGRGIPASALKKVFDPFFSLRPGGAGLGLFIVYKLVQDNHGDIYIQSQEGVGTCVSLIFFSAVKER